MTRRLVITGANGFVGTHLAEQAAADGVEVWALGREAEPRPALAPHAARYYSADLEHVWPVDDDADAVVHLAGLAAVGPSFDHPQLYLTVNSGLMTTMSEAIRTHSRRPRVVVVSTGAVYAPPAGGHPLDEGAPTTAGSPYAVAKLLVEMQAAYYATRGIDTVVARPFNHIGPGQGPGFIVPDLTSGLDRLDGDAALPVGNLDAARDYTDVRDVAHAYLELAFAAGHRHPVYNVASGESHTGREVLAAIAGAQHRAVPPLEVDPSRLRPNDPARITGDASRLTKEFGWSPRIDWRTSIAEFVASRG